MKRTSETGASVRRARNRRPEAAAASNSLLARAQREWLLGDWTAVASLDRATVGRDPAREQLALLVATALQQRDRHDEARSWVDRALAWGCDRGLAARLMVSALHNTFGRIAALRGDDDAVAEHFGAAFSLLPEPAAPSATHARAVREMAALGLLPAAATLIQEEVDSFSERGLREDAAARLAILKSEVELLVHELSLAQQRGQLDGGREAMADRLTGDAYVETLRRKSTSQIGQDLWVLERSVYRRGGFFVEFGASDGVLLSNTLLLEREFGWNGICAEPNPGLFAQLRANRRCGITDACVGARTGDDVEFILADAYGGVASFADCDMHAEKRRAYRSAGAVVSLRTESLNDMLLRMGAPREIDYLSIDTEGSELEILSAFPFAEWRVRLLTVEHNFTPARDAIRALLEGHGYRCTESLHDDWYELQG